MPITSNADQLAAGVRSAAGQLAAGLGVESDMAAAMLAAARTPRRTGTYAASLRVAVEPPKFGIAASADYANIIEFGSRWVPGRRVLAKAVEDSTATWTQIGDTGLQKIADTI